MVSGGTLTAFSLIALGMALIPGPNMVYVMMRSQSFGPFGGLMAVVAVTLGVMTHLLMAAFGISALVVAVPHALEVLRVAGTVTLAYLAWKTWVTTARAFDPQDMSQSGGVKAFGLGILISLLNPAIALVYLTFLPPFIDTARGSVLQQTLVLGTVHILIEIFVNSGIAITANGILRFFDRPNLALLPRLLTSLILVGVATRTLLTSAPPPSAFAANKQVEIAALHKEKPVPHEADCGIPEASGSPDFVFDPLRAKKLYSDRAIGLTSQMSIESPQAGAQSIPLLARKFGQGNFLAIPNEAPEPLYTCGMTDGIHDFPSSLDRPLMRHTPRPIGWRSLVFQLDDDIGQIFILDRRF
jgi:threonine/homoserine/homoserine lactone efflux protein